MYIYILDNMNTNRIACPCCLVRCTKAEANNTQCHTRQHLLCSSELCYHACQGCFNCPQRTPPLKVTYAKHVHPTRNKYYEWLHPRCVPTFPHACTEANFYVKPTQKQCPRQNRVMTFTAKTKAVVINGGHRFFIHFSHR